jgi:hypothetical protein
MWISILNLSPSVLERYAGRSNKIHRRSFICESCRYHIALVEDAVQLYWVTVHDIIRYVFNVLVTHSHIFHTSVAKEVEQPLDVLLLVGWGEWYGVGWVKLNPLVTSLRWMRWKENRSRATSHSVGKPKSVPIYYTWFYNQLMRQ